MDGTNGFVLFWLAKLFCFICHIICGKHGKGIKFLWWPKVWVVLVWLNILQAKMKLGKLQVKNINNKYRFIGPIDIEYKTSWNYFYFPLQSIILMIILILMVYTSPNIFFVKFSIWPMFSAKFISWISFWEVNFSLMDGMLSELVNCQCMNELIQCQKCFPR